jgi:hypothetical protein
VERKTRRHKKKSRGGLLLVEGGMSWGTVEELYITIKGNFSDLKSLLVGFSDVV